MKTKKEIKEMVNPELRDGRNREAVIKALSIYEEEILKEIDNMRKGLDNPDYSYSNEYIEDFFKELKSKINGRN